MATAPTPGGNKQALGKVVRITLAGRTLEIDTSELGPGDDLLARQQTGIPISGFLAQGNFAADSLLVLWWWARRKNGEPNLQFAEVLAEYPSYADLADAAPSAVQEDGVGEASGPGSPSTGPTSLTSSVSIPAT